MLAPFTLKGVSNHSFCQTVTQIVDNVIYSDILSTSRKAFIPDGHT